MEAGSVLDRMAEVGMIFAVHSKVESDSRVRLIVTFHPVVPFIYKIRRRCMVG